jgi:predicted AlkP superfamily pyrophosphatase or phosphodiesterase
MPRIFRIALVLLPSLAFIVFATYHLNKRWNEPVSAVGSSNRGRLVIVAVFDQMRGDYPNRWAKLYGTTGFERIKKDGISFRDAHLPYSCSSTAPGHASISTGLPPSEHGIVENKWYDRKRNAETYAITSLRPHPRVPAAGKENAGFAPEQLLAESIGDHLKRFSPNSRVFSLALKDRSAMLLGGKKPDGVYCFDTYTGEFHTTSYYTDRVHNWVSQFNSSHLADRWFESQWERLTDEATANAAVGPDDRAGETKFDRDTKTGGLVGYGPTFPHAMNIDGQPHPNVRYYDRVEASPFGNELVWSLAKTCISNERLGQRDTADLLFLGFSSNDLIGHKWGPDSHEVLDVTIRTDRLIGQMIAHLDQEIGAENYTLVITSDHGIVPLPEVSIREHPGAMRFDPRTEFGPDGLGKALNHEFGELDPAGRGWFGYLDREGSQQIHLNHQAILAHGCDVSKVAAFAAKWATERPMIHKAFTRETLTGPKSEDQLLRQAQLGFHPERCGDVYLVYQPYTLPTGVNSTGTSHGSPHPYDTHVPILVFGAGIPAKGIQADRVSSLIVAPIVANALNLTPQPGWEPLPKCFEK